MNKKVSNAEELLELIRNAVKDVDYSINNAISNLKDAKAYAEDIEYIYANDLYNLAERGVEEREINATCINLVWDEDEILPLANFIEPIAKHLSNKKEVLARAKNIRIRFYEILDKEEGDEQN